MIILSIDPGLNNTGISILDLTNEFKVLETTLVKNTRKFTDSEKIIEQKFGNRVVKVSAILSAINELVSKYNIKDIIIEAPFYNALTPMAYGSLLEVIYSIKYTIVVNKDINFKLVEPLLVKKLFTKNHLAGKELIKFHLSRMIDSKEIFMDKDINELSEHEIDSIAIGYVHYMELKE